MLFYEDIHPGWENVFGPIKVSQEDIIAFASEYDAQDFHIDPEKARHTLPGRLIASGWHSCALANKLLAENLLMKSAAQGSPGIEELRWTEPLFPGDELRLQITVDSARTSNSRPDIGVVLLKLKLLKQDGVVSTSMRCPIFVRRRNLGQAPERVTSPMPARSKPTAQENDIARAKAIPVLPFVEEMYPGQITALGSHTFTADEIIRFARQFDPQYFHIDAAAAKNSLFGGLCASGWHTVANWMRVTSTLFRTLTEKMQAEGKPVPQLGPSPGFSGLKWLKPVFAGDTIRYTSRVIRTRSSTSRHGWGLIFSHNTGVNQNDEPVLSFDSVVLRQMRPE